MKWQFNIPAGSKSLSFKAEVLYTTHQVESIKVAGEGLSLVLSNNRPLLEAIELKQPLRWRLIGGEVKDAALLAKIQKEAETYLCTQNAKPAVKEPVRKLARA